MRVAQNCGQCEACKRASEGKQTEGGWGRTCHNNFSAQANLQVRREQYAEALPLYEQVLQDAEHSQPCAKRATMLRNRSYVLCKLGRPLEALDDAQEAIGIEPTIAGNHWRKYQALSELDEGSRHGTL